MKEYYMSLIDAEDNYEIEFWGPLPWNELEKLYPEIETDEDGLPTQYVTIQEA